MKRLLVSLFTVIIVILKPFNASCQIITHAEYFINTDPGVGKGILIIGVPGFDVDVDFSIDVSTFQPGFNQLFVRVEDDSDNWSIAEQRTFFIDSTLHTLLPVTAAEYFIDADPGADNGISLNIQSGNILDTILKINTQNLQDGFHQLFIRVKDQFNKWSIAEQRTFVVDNGLALNNAPVPVVAAEFYINSDSGVGNNSPMPLVKSFSVDTSYAYKMSNLPLGRYTMNLRVKDSLGRWSIVESRPFTVDNSALPITLINLQAGCSDHNTILSWQTASEINSDHFEIQRSNNSIAGWETIGVLKAAGYSTALSSYQFRDTQNSGGLKFYRLRQLDKDGREFLSEIHTSNCDFEGLNIEVYPVPAKNVMNIIFRAAKNNNVTVLLIDTYGNIIRQLYKYFQKGVNKVIMNVADLPSGVYFVKAQGTELTGIQKVIISR